MDEFIEIFSKPLFTFFEHTFTLAELVFIPVALIVGFIVTKWLVSMFGRRLTTKGVNPDLVHLIQRLLYVLAIIILIITTLDFLNVPITAFAFLSGAIAIGFGFGAQNIINNFISGWILMWERPIRIGDSLEVEDTRGRVEAINTRSTRIRRVDGVHMLIPNSMLLENTVINWTLIDKTTRSTVRVGVAYGSDCRLVADLIKQATVEQEGVLPEPEPNVIFDDFGDNALMFEVYFWMNATVERDLRVMRSNIRFRIDELFHEHDIVIAFPQRDVHLDGKLQLINVKQEAADNG